MQKYFQKSPIASIADKILRVIITALIGVAWFVYLWGLSIASLCAGVALGGLLWLCVRLFSKNSVRKREAQMRRMIGGELAVNRLLLLGGRHAAFQAALWLTPKIPLRMHKAIDFAVHGEMDCQKVYFRLIAQHESLPINVQQIIDVLKESQQAKAKRCILCLTAPLSSESIQYANHAPLPIELISRDELITYAGLCCPATDEDLSLLAKRGRMRKRPKEWLTIALDVKRMRRYFWYGISLLALAILTKHWVYPIPAVFCLTLYVLCKVQEHRKACLH